jgi:adenylylsulfate kinase-like enzyme
VRHRKNHQKAVGAVARHLAEATYWILTKEVSYQEPQRKTRKTDASTKASTQMGAGHDLSHFSDRVRGKGRPNAANADVPSCP